MACLSGEKRPNSSTELFEVGHEETWGEHFAGSHCGASKGKKKQKDFVKRNIEVCQSSHQAKCSAWIYCMTWSKPLICLFFQWAEYLSSVQEKDILKAYWGTMKKNRNVMPIMIFVLFSPNTIASKWWGGQRSFDSGRKRASDWTPARNRWRGRGWCQRCR